MLRSVNHVWQLLRFLTRQLAADIEPKDDASEDGAELLHSSPANSEGLAKRPKNESYDYSKEVVNEARRRNGDNEPHASDVIRATKVGKVSTSGEQGIGDVWSRTHALRLGVSHPPLMRLLISSCSVNFQTVALPLLLHPFSLRCTTMNKSTRALYLTHS